MTVKTGSGTQTPAAINRRTLLQSIRRIRAIRREVARRRVLRDGDIEYLAHDILGYQIEPIHRELLEFQSLADDRCLQLAPRGFGKSTILVISLALFEILRNPDIRILIVSNTQIQAEVFLREVKAHFEVNERLRECFGNFVSEDKWDVREVLVKPRTSTKKESTVTCVGVGGPVASRHYDLILADDVVNEDNAYTDVQREKLRTWWYKTLDPCLEPEGRLLATGTRYHPLDLYGHFIKNEFKDKHQVIPALDDSGESAWPEKFPVAWLEERRRQMGSTIFNSQYQNDTTLMKGSIFREEWLRRYEEPPEWKNMSHFVGCDPAATKRDQLITANKTDSDWWTIVVGARKPGATGILGSDIYVRYVWRARCTKDEYIEKLKAVNERFQPIAVGIEDVAAQEYLVQDAEKYMPVRRIPRTQDKVARAYWLQAFFENGQIVLPAAHLVEDADTWQALEEELLLFPQAAHDDLFDGLESMVEVSMKYGDYGSDDIVLTESMLGDDW